MSDFLSAEGRALPARKGLPIFDILWVRQLDAVDEPNTSQCGWSSVFRLELAGQGDYLKFQSNYLTRTLHKPFGGPTFAREFRSISRYQKLGIPALLAVLFGGLNVKGERRAMLLPRTLNGWNDLDSLLEKWSQLIEVQHCALLLACGLASRLHSVCQLHGCFYPGHSFTQEADDGYAKQLINLEKNRPLLFCQRDRTKDLEPLLLLAPQWSDTQLRQLLAASLDQPKKRAFVGARFQCLTACRSRKENR